MTMTVIIYVDNDDNDKPAIHADTPLISYNNSEPILTRSLKCGDLLVGRWRRKAKGSKANLQI